MMEPVQEQDYSMRIRVGLKKVLPLVLFHEWLMAMVQDINIDFI